MQSLRFFGLGSYTDALLTVAWPDGSNQTRTINSGEINNGGAPLVVFDTHMPALNQPSVSASIELLPNLNINWVFTWETGNSTDPKKDTVKVQTYDPGGKYTPPPQCIMNPVTLRYDINNVVHTYVAKQGGGYIHTLRYENRPCNAPCTFEYQVTSALAVSRSAQSPWKQFTVPVCVQ